MKLVGYTRSDGLQKTTSVLTAGPGIRNSFRFHDLFEFSCLIFSFDFFVVVVRCWFQSIFSLLFLSFWSTIITAIRNKAFLFLYLDV